jgi:hypothetical protein
MRQCQLVEVKESGIITLTNQMLECEPWKKMSFSRPLAVMWLSLV